MKNHLILTQTEKWKHEIYLSNGKPFGTFEQDNDGYFYYVFPEKPVTGLTPWFILAELALKLSEINEPWDHIVRQNIEGKPSLMTHYHT